MWTWVSGPANVPEARADAVSWTDGSGNLWLFGGYGPDPGLGGWAPFNDMWRFSPITNEWTWVSGSATPSQGVYGTRGVPDVANSPGARLYALNWIDGNGNLWLFGGFGSDSTGRNYFSLNDLWEFNPTDNTWTWVSGANTPNQSGVSGTQGVPAATNVPGARLGSISWVDKSGNFWLFGGQGYDIAGSTGMLNDLWKFNPTSMMWTWVSGSSVLPASGGTQGIYGTMGVPNPANAPGSREMPVSWTDSNGGLWLFGGYGQDSTSGGYLNDLWRYQPPVACGATHYLCSPSTITSTNQVSGTSAWTWTCSDGVTTVQCSQSKTAPAPIENLKK